MITEDYCSYEVAETLKEKGFDEQTVKCYNLRKELCNCQCGPGETINSISNYFIAAPTHQMAMKWLREKHKMYICVGVKVYDSASGVINGYSSHVWFEPKNNKGICCYWPDKNDSDDFDTYEEACEAAIKYCLENLFNEL